MGQDQLKIAFVIPGIAGGGVRSVLRIATGLASRGHQVRVLYRHPRRKPRDLARTYYLKLRYGGGEHWRRRLPDVVHPYRTLTPELVGSNDVVIGVGVSCVLEIADLPERCGIKVHNSRGAEPWIVEKMSAAWRLSMPRIVVGSHLVELMRQRGSDDPISVAHNGVDRAEYFPALPPEARDGVGTVYHGGVAKDPKLILNVLNALHERCPSTPLYVFGTFPRPKALPHKATYVRFPKLPVARDLYSRSLVWFLASRNEGLPNPLLEAMACGCAVVSTDCGGASDIITHGENGLIVPVGDAEAMTSAILELLRDEPLRRRFTLACTEVLERFTWPAAVASFETALLSIGSAGRSHPGETPPARSSPSPAMRTR